MGKKGKGLLSLLKRVFIPGSKEKISNALTSDQVTPKEKKKWNLVKLKHGPSSIEQILREAEHGLHSHSHALAPPVNAVSTVYPPSASAKPKTAAGTPKASSSNPSTTTQEPIAPAKTAISREARDYPPVLTREQRTPPPPPLPSPLPTVNVAKEYVSAVTPNCSHYKLIPNHQAAATKIQTAFRAYLARRSYRAVKGLVRLQEVMRGQSVQRQTMNTMRYMQQLVRMQIEIHTRRMQMLQRQGLLKTRGTEESSCLSVGNASAFVKYTDDGREGWDDSLITKQEADARLQRKVGASISRERALAYAYSHQDSKGMSTSAQALLMEIRSTQLQWGWTWLERRQPTQSCPVTHEANGGRNEKPKMLFDTQHTPSTSRRMPIESSLDFTSSHSSRSFTVARTRKNSKQYLGSPWTKDHKFNPIRDDESITSCQTFSSVPNYMAPTISAQAKVKTLGNLNEKYSKVQSDRRSMFSSPRSTLSSFRWNQASNFTSREINSTARRNLFGAASNNKKAGMRSPGNASVDSTVSLPVGVVNRKPFR